MRHDPRVVAALLDDAGFTVTAELSRPPDGPFETVPQAYLLMMRA